ncbi:MAG: hypothetical protein Kow0074_14030 [Candidatus Zixiibacteriota bacterium]
MRPAIVAELLCRTGSNSDYQDRMGTEGEGFGIMATEETQGPGSKTGEMVTGLILLGLGIIFLLNSLDIWDLGDSWPLILVTVGLSLIAGELRKNSADGSSPS